MAEGRSLKLAIETSDDYLPDFREIVEHGKKQISATLTKAEDRSTPERRQGRIVTDSGDVEIVANLEKLRRILIDQSFEPLLLELAVVHDRRLARNLQSELLRPVDGKEEQHFTSYMASYLGRFEQEKSLLITAWNQTIDELLKHQESGQYSLMAYKETYEEAFLTEQFNWAVSNRRRASLPAGKSRDSEKWSDKTKEIVRSRNSVVGKLERVHTALDSTFWKTVRTKMGNSTGDTSNERSQAEARSRIVTDESMREYLETVPLDFRPTVYSNTYRFSLIPDAPESEIHDVKGAVSYLAAGLIYSLDEGFRNNEESKYSDSIQDFLMNCHLLVLPFRRPVAFDPESNVELKSWGDSPGGCLFAIFKPRLGSMVSADQLEDLATCLSLALSRAALRESYIAAEVVKQKDDVMRLVSHQFPSLIKEFRFATRIALDAIGETRTEPDLETARKQLNFALDVSESLLGVADCGLHSFKVQVGADQPRPLKYGSTLEKLCKAVNDLTIERWRRICNVGGGDGLCVSFPIPAVVDAGNEMNLRYDPGYVEYVLPELLRNSFKHGANQLAPTVEIMAIKDELEVFLIVTNNLKPDGKTDRIPKSRIGLTSLEEAAIAYGFSRPQFSRSSAELRFVAKVAIARLD